MATAEFPDVDEFEEQFRRKCGRYLTAEERKFFLLAEHLLKYPPPTGVSKPAGTRILKFAPTRG